METYIHENLSKSAKLETLMKGKPGKHVFKFSSGRKRVMTVNSGELLTEQAHAKECDMNYILRDYEKTGLIKHANKHAGRYDDVTVQDFQEAQFLIAEAKNMFQELPSTVRKRFDNNPGQFLEFVQNPNNKAEMQVMGILKGNDGLNAKGEMVNSPKEGATAPVEGATAPTE